MIYHLRHLTTFSYSQPVTVVYNALHLKARPLPWQHIRSSRLTVRPEPAVLAERLDGFGNIATFFTLQEQHDRMGILVESVVEVAPRNPMQAGGTPWNLARMRMKGNRSPAGLDAYQFSFDSPCAKIFPEACDYALLSVKEGRSIHDVAIDLMDRIHRDFVFDPTATTVSTPVRDVLKNRRGVCQDFAHLMICCLRSIGLAARYISGYIQTTPPPGKPRLKGADASHAWVGVYCPQNGWLDLDPTNNKLANEEFITIGWGRDYQDVSPVTGVLIGGGEHKVRAEVDMVPETEIIQSQQQQQQ